MPIRRLPSLFYLIVLATAYVPSAFAQDKPISTNICNVVKDPAAFDNKLVRMRATLTGNFEISAIADPDHKDCGVLWFTYPGSGPAAMVSMSRLTPTQSRPVINLKKDDNFARFQKLVDTPMYPRRRGIMCMGCSRYEVTAVMIGLVEFAGSDAGYGHMNGFPVQFVLQSIGDTSVKDLAPGYDAKDFSTTPIRFPTGYIIGTVIGPNGRHIADATLQIYLTKTSDAYIGEDLADTDAKGHFKFSVPPGEYIIGFNTFWTPSPQFPFPPTYYPSTPDRSAAKTVVVVDAQHVDNIILKLPQPLVARIFPVTVTLSDGTPVNDANVWLSQLSEPTSVVGTSVSHTAADGTFDLKGFQGMDYILHANKYAGLARVSCSRNILIRAEDSIPARIQLSFTITNFDICTDPHVEASTDPGPRR